MTSDITLADAIAALVAEKRAVGYKYAAEARVLARFEAFCRVEFPGLGTVSQVSVEAWVASARRRGVRPATLQALAAPVRELARWLGRRGVRAYVLPAGVLARPARYVPHIYTDQELAALFAQTDRCRYCSQVPFRHLVMPVLFRTIYACGLRLSEARLLRPGDVDIDAGVLQVRDAKGGKDRQVPVSEPLRVRLSDYHAQLVGRSAQVDLGLVLPRPERPAADGREHRQELPPVPLAGAYLPRRAGPRSPRSRPAAHLRGQQSPFLVRSGPGRRRAAAGSADVYGSFVAARHRLLPAVDRRVLPGHHRPSPTGHRRRRPARHRRAAPWRLTSRSACDAS